MWKDLSGILATSFDLVDDLDFPYTLYGFPLHWILARILASADILPLALNIQETAGFNEKL